MKPFTHSISQLTRDSFSWIPQAVHNYIITVGAHNMWLINQFQEEHHQKVVANSPTARQGDLPCSLQGGYFGFPLHEFPLSKRTLPSKGRDGSKKKRRRWGGWGGRRGYHHSYLQLLHLHLGGKDLLLPLQQTTENRKETKTSKKYSGKEENVGIPWR